MNTYQNLANEFKRTKSSYYFTKLYFKIKPGLKNYIKNIVKDEEVTNDILAKTFSKIYEHIESYDENFSITTWVYTIAKRECLRWIKRERNKHLSLDYLSEYGSEATEDSNNHVSVSSLNLILESSEYKTEEEYLNDDMKLQYQYNCAVDLIKNLKPIYRDILIDVLLNKMKYKEVAFKYDKQLKSAKEKYEAATDIEKNNLKKNYERIYKRALQRVKNRVRRGKFLVAESLKNMFPDINV